MRQRLILSFVLIVVITIAAMVILAGRGTASQVRAFMFRGGMVGIEDLAAALEDYYQANGSWQGVDQAALFPGRGPGWRRGNPQLQPGMMMGGMMAQRLRLADPEGVVLVDSDDPDPQGWLDPAELGRAIPLRADRLLVGYLLPEGGATFTQIDEANLLRGLNRAALSAALVAGGLALLLAFVLGYQLVRPVNELTRAAGRLAKGDLSQRVAVRGNDEMATLGRAFNQMAAALEQSEESRRAMTADIAHELRNPLAVQRAHLEALQDGIYPATPENLDPILEQNLLLTRLVEDLRTLALADAGQLQMEPRPVDLEDLLRRVAARFARQAEAGLISTDLTIINPCPPALVDPGRIEQVIGNLLSNAIRYTTQGGRIEIRLECTPGSARLLVHDGGPGIPEEALPYVFDRFYRADRARSRSEGGSGLGLAIARQLVQAHGGTMTAANHLQGGAVFTVELPLGLDERISPA
ncbi:MAG TPA: ATP-binding protein [Anaerolineales bacterium]|nr:ATP-binding protein [Anaerolineales bacterium]